MANTVDIEFDRYGDISLFGNDISVVRDSLDFIYQGVIDRLITNQGDYDLYRSFGANISGYIGRRNDSLLEEEVIKSIRTSLTNDGFLDNQLVQILSIRNIESLLIKITIGNPTDSLSELIVINSIFNTSSGLLYVTN